MVEFALVLPVALLTLLVAFNTLMFASECAKFDRVASEAMRSAVTVTPASAIPGHVIAKIEQGMGYSAGKVASRFNVDAKVSGNAAPFFFDHRTITCYLYYEPWPAPRTFGFGALGPGANVKLGTLTHAKRLTIDHYMPAGLF